MNARTRADSELIARWIVADPHKANPAEARVLPRGTAVWVVIGQLQLDRWSVETVAETYDLLPEAVEAAIGYYHQHEVMIDQRIAANRAFFAV